MTDEELDAAVAETLIPVPMGALSALQEAANGYLEILKRGVRPEAEEEFAEALRIHSTACKAISAAYDMARAELERDKLRARGGALH
jgi:hypothetical protein